ncbi:Cyclic pyranopterin phosphate synthase (MoaA) [hydrothermal vent metagenome]|uniref:GTP 3',8-cyclase n=1 Tax=hydrothermal vent metagenome TaxID=652676 RepID=A0A3B1B5U5_9ZZZZ
MKSQLIDPFGRKIEYLRLSVTDKCNMRCFYCLPKGYNDFDNASQHLTQDEMVRIVGAFADLGVHRVRLTGGEPLVRKDICELSARLSRLPGLEDLSLSTNASLLKDKAAQLKQVGITRINVSLDTLRPERHREINGGRLSDAIDGLMAAKAAGFHPIKINMVAMKGINDDEFEDMVAFCIKHDFTLRFIETMPISVAGRKGSEHYLDLHDVETHLQQNFELIPGVMPSGGPARYVKVSGANLRIGFITPISQHFCETCNRVRLTSSGTLFLCLGHEHKIELRELLRNGLSDEGLKQCLIDALILKPERHHFTEKPSQIVRFMANIGG